MSMRAVIVEDLEPAAEILERYCRRCGMVEVLHRFGHAGEALGYLADAEVELLFLDVEMPDMTGFELLRRLGRRMRVILTTSRTEYAYDAFEHDVVDFLGKPFSYERFLRAVAKAAPGEIPRDAPEAVAPILIRVGRKTISLDQREVMYVEGLGDYVRFVTGQGRYLTHATIKETLTRLDAHMFLRVHRSYVVNMGHVHDLREDSLRVGDASLPVSRANRGRVRQRIRVA